MTTTEGGKHATVGCPFCGKLNRVDMSRAGGRPKCGECGKPLLLDRPVTATDATMQQIIRNSDVPVLVDFYADWCGPCKTMAPILDDLARERMGRALVVKLDTDRNPAMARQYEIRGIPTLIVFRDGEEIKRQVGGGPRGALEAMLDSH
jgi:thioredoxin 2